ncbi:MULTISPECIES: hypothetical protein [unclassified Nocardioides]|uniref:hypothetical protein n=1 Tax=unclassified Nocardioides TaxID=2615069 RepID=UPI000AA78578|nr:MULTISPECIES: hypothetical protein [unclassified Nocardioides]MBJ7529679.1 hypothetical protein [Nocardioides sp.]
MTEQPEDLGVSDRHPAGSSDDAPEQVDLVAAAVLAVPGVADLHGGVLGEVATYLPGRRVSGVKLLEPGASVHVVLTWGAAVATTTAAVREVVRPLVPGPVHVVVEDVEPPGGAPR